MSAAGAKKATIPAAHPTYMEMIKAAIGEMKERTGCSRQAILKHVVANNKVDANKAAVQVRICLLPLFLHLLFVFVFAVIFVVNRSD